MKNRKPRSLPRSSFTAQIATLSAAALLGACNSPDSPTPSYNNCTPAASAQSRLAEQLVSSPMVQAMRQTPSHIPMAVKNMSDNGTVSAARKIPVNIALALNNEDELGERISQMYQPGHPNYRKYMSQEEFAERYAPSAQQIAEAESFLAQHGIESDSIGPTGLFIHAHATVAALNAAFVTEIHEYRDAAGATRFAPAYEPQMPAGLSIQAVHGLESPIALHHHAVPNLTPQSGSGSGGGLTPANIHTAYGIPSSVNGAGQTIALVELDGYKQSDITAYENAFGLGATSLTMVPIAGATGTAGSNSSEVTLDIELTTAIAPAASIKVYESPNDSVSLLSLYEAIAADSSVNEVSTSWGMAESEYPNSFLQSESGVFRQMAAVGKSVYAAAGDAGAFASGGSTLSVEDPSTQPFVVAVGGTRLTSGVGGAYVSETTWYDGGSDATGGGVSNVWGAPSWQSGITHGANLASSSMRNVPDISLNSDPNTGYSIYLNGAWVVYGGTSCAAPIWSAFTALVNEKRVSSGLAVLGFTDPYLYSLGEVGASYANDFHDIADGSSNGHYPAVTGYDDATGWGSMKGASLFNDLSTEPAQSSSSIGC